METRMVCLCLLELMLCSAPAEAQFGFAQVRAEAQKLSQAAFVPSTNRVPENLLTLDYTKYQSIQFDRRAALWAQEGLPFQVEFFLPGFIHKQIVPIHEVDSDRVKSVPFSPSAFFMGTNRLDLSAADLGYAGFRILHVNRRTEEIAAFLDASYFRMAGDGQALGASARGLALNTVRLGQEEFPAFREFWLRKPSPRESAITVWAIMDSPSVAGAFEFSITSGVTTVTRTKAAFFLRREVPEFGVAPVSSMFLYDENSHPPNSDFRPEVHDSDGLLLHTGRDEWIWRPLERGKMLRVNSYQDTKPRGFGLLQRDRDFEHYQDLIGRFDLRPSVWIEPAGDWGPGGVELVQIPSDLEYTDNAVAFWVPGVLPKPGGALDVAYNIHWTTNEPAPASLAHVQATRIGQVPQSAPGEGPHLRLVIDFGGPAAHALSAREQLDAEWHCGSGAKLVATQVRKNEVNGTWRLILELTAPAKAVDLDARLVRRGRPVTETWAYTWQP